MVDPVDPGIEVEITPNHNQPIASVRLSAVAFVGRTRRGPLNRPITVRSFSDFRKEFGGLWLASPMSYALEQFFGNGGEAATVVRVIKGASRASVALAAGAETLTLEAVNPGSYEFLRVAVDYDHIGPQYHHLFNLTVQRVESAQSALVSDQEIYNQISTVAESDRSVALILKDSKLVRVRGAVPIRRPDITGSQASNRIYQEITQDGHDGDVLSGQDLIGDRQKGSGLFALGSLEFPFVCLPPPSRNQDIEPHVWQQALDFCRARDAVLIVDPHRTWTTAADAKAGFRALELNDSHAVAVFPGLNAEGMGYQAPCGAVAGLLMRTGAERLDWEFPVGWRIRGVKKFSTELSSADVALLNQSGINCLREVNAIAKIMIGDRTLSNDDRWRSLTASRFAHFLRVSIRRGTRWAVFAKNDQNLWASLCLQVTRFLEKQFQWAVDNRDLENLFYVRCDASTNPPAERDQGRINIEVGFALEQPGSFHRITITQIQAPKY